MWEITLLVKMIMHDAKYITIKETVKARKYLLSEGFVIKATYPTIVGKRDYRERRSCLCVMPLARTLDWSTTDFQTKAWRDCHRMQELVPQVRSNGDGSCCTQQLRKQQKTNLRAAMAASRSCHYEEAGRKRFHLEWEEFCPDPLTGFHKNVERESNS